jgi:hypothetical protein
MTCSSCFIEGIHLSVGCRSSSISCRTFDQVRNEIFTFAQLQNYETYLYEADVIKAKYLYVKYTPACVDNNNKFIFFSYL